LATKEAQGDADEIRSLSKAIEQEEKYGNLV
jgi:hypothetical protein